MRGHTSYGYGPEPSRARHLLVLAAAALALVALGGLAVGFIGLVTGEKSGQFDSSKASASTTTDDTGGSGEQAGEDVGQWESDPDTGLPIGATSRDGHPIGFPRTDLGAAAMVVELNRAQIGLDYDTALTTIRVYATAEDQRFFDELATSAVAQRRNDLGVPTQGALTSGGEVNAPAGYAQTPVGYQVQEYGPDSYLVSVLNEVTTTTSNGRVTRSAYVGQQFVSWTTESEGGDGSDAGDWQLVEPSEAKRDQLLTTALPAVAQLSEPEFERAGWTPLLNPPTPTGTSSDNDSGAADPSVDDGSQ